MEPDLLRTRLRRRLFSDFTPPWIVGLLLVLFLAFQIDGLRGTGIVIGAVSLMVGLTGGLFAIEGAESGERLHKAVGNLRTAAQEADRNNRRQMELLDRLDVREEMQLLRGIESVLSGLHAATCTTSGDVSERVPVHLGEQGRSASLKSLSEALVDAEHLELRRCWDLKGKLSPDTWNFSGQTADEHDYRPDIESAWEELQSSIAGCRRRLRSS